jgi:hypothetical protein
VTITNISTTSTVAGVLDVALEHSMSQATDAAAPAVITILNASQQDQAATTAVLESIPAVAGMTMPTKALLVDGDWFRICDGQSITTYVDFEFGVTPGHVPTPGRVLVDVSAASVVSALDVWNVFIPILLANTAITLRYGPFPSGPNTASAGIQQTLIEGSAGNTNVNEDNVVTAFFFLFDFWGGANPLQLLGSSVSFLLHSERLYTARIPYTRWTDGHAADVTGEFLLSPEFVGAYGDACRFTQGRVTVTAAFTFAVNPDSCTLDLIDGAGNTLVANADMEGGVGTGADRGTADPEGINTVGLKARLTITGAGRTFADITTGEVLIFLYWRDLSL